METCIGPNLSPGERRVVVCFHDESTCHTNVRCHNAWKRYGKTGTMKDKDKGDSCMVAGYICQEIGMCL